MTDNTGECKCCDKLADEIKRLRRYRADMHDTFEQLATVMELPVTAGADALLDTVTCLRRELAEARAESEYHRGQELRLASEVHHSGRELAEAQSERQREHDLRVKLAGELETTMGQLAEARNVLTLFVEDDGGATYYEEGAEFGIRNCCKVRDYKDHVAGCKVLRAKALLAALEVPDE